MKIICIGRNYTDHAKELKNEVPKEPVIFLKPETALLNKKTPFFIPNFSKEIHHELELVIKINRLGKNIAEKFAHKYYDSITCGIDFTARDLQNELKEKKLPWEKAKAFDNSAPVGNFVKLNELDNHKEINFSLKINDKTVQQGNSRDMLFSFDKIVSNVSQFFTLKIGDLIFTGTPAGVGKVNIGDHLACLLEDKPVLQFDVK